MCPDLGHISEIKWEGFKNICLSHVVVIQRAVWKRKELKRNMGHYSVKRAHKRRKARMGGRR